MVNFHIIIPFSRAHNAEAIKSNIAEASEGLVGTVKVIPVCHNKEHVGLFPTPMLVLLREGWDACYWKLNCALDQMTFGPSDVVGFICDDDLYEKSFFTELEKRMARPIPRVTVVNMKRWFHGDNPVDELGANPGNMRVGLVGLEQIYIRGDIMNGLRFNNFSHGDGDLVERMHRDFPNDFLFVPELFANWNKLKP